MANHELNEVRSRRATLYDATLDLEHAIGSPTGDLRKWWSRSLAAARELELRISEHKRQTDETGELLDVVTKQAPQLVNAAKKLEGEHDELMSKATDFVGVIKRVSPQAIVSGASSASAISSSTESMTLNSPDAAFVIGRTTTAN